jgi:uncharacterized membrane protein YhhN
VSAELVGVLSGIGAAHLLAYYTGHRVVAGLLKAAPVLALAGLVYLESPRAGAFVALGLLLSAVGDVSLVFPTGFLVGLSAFLLAHLCYIATFAPGAAVTPLSIAAAVALVVVGAGMLRYLWPHVRHSRVRFPMVVYVAALTSMTWCAVARGTVSGAGAAEAAAAVGAVSFLVSDGVLSVNRFARPFAGAHAVVMVTYYAAQMLIARSML